MQQTIIPKLLRRKTVEQLTGLSRSSIYRLMQLHQFPPPVKISAKAVAWPEPLIYNWIASRQASHRYQAA